MPEQRAFARGAAGHPERFGPALERLQALARSRDDRLRGLFRAAEPLWIGRAPGRLDVMGGIADYSGSLVLQLPLARATFAVVQPRSDRDIQVASTREGRVETVVEPLRRLLGDPSDSPAALGERMREAGHGWAAYLFGVLRFCVERALARRPGTLPGLSVLIDSQVPEGAGVSSSAALEVSCMAAACACLGVEMSAEEIAAAAQWVENHVVGAPCGIMDQLTSAVGRQDHLLRLRCQPAIIEGYHPVPEGIRLFGIDSGVRHAVSGADYARVRAAAFMGRRILRDAVGIPPAEEGEDTGRSHRPWGPYLADLTPSELRELEGQLPEFMSGAEFLARYGDHGDAATRIRPEVRYPVRTATRHPVLENDRVQRFAALLAAVGTYPEAAGEMGRLMGESHASYSACGLGSEGTDRLVQLVEEAGSAAGLHGAKITGGGSGGTVAILGQRDAEREVRRIAARYAEENGSGGEVFADSGPGMQLYRLERSDR